ncbi:RING finger protein 141-like [Watersipora subatra]|uniref:RING finger protein 141-like n=1 Tax=Watersipora subatra TaxID=2589382 RepID=UPI00355BEC74
MGQNQVKVGLQIRKQAQSVMNTVSSPFSDTIQLKSLTYDQFVHELELLNQILDELTKSSDKTVSFSIERGSHKNFMWKIFTKIVCEKVMRNNGYVMSTKLLSVKRFMRLYADITHQMTAALTASSQLTRNEDLDTESSQLSASMIIDGIEDSGALPFNPENDNECCICMERDCELILPCTHGYCEQCINHWSETSRNPRDRHRQNTCPICRGPLQDASNDWVMSEAGVAPPESGEMPSLVLGLVDQAGVTTVTSTDTNMSQATASLSTSDTPDGYTLVSMSSATQ